MPPVSAAAHRIAPSRRLQAAAEAELKRVARRHDQLLAKAAILETQLQAVEKAADELRQQLVELADLAQVPLGLAARRNAPPPDARRGVTGRVVKGKRIRIEAVRAVVAAGERDQALHYRQWFARFSDAGFAIDTPDPIASFLTQLGRSPVVMRSSKAGIYAIDPDAVAKLRARIESAETALRDATESPLEMAVRRARALAALRRDLDEAIESLDVRSERN